MREISGLAEIAADYDAFLIDQFGVLHDGRKLYPGALEALERLHALGKLVVILTNSGKRTAANRERLVGMGVRRELFRDVLSSGEVARASIAAGDFDPAFFVFVVGRAGDDYAFDFDELNLAELANPDDANLILILGSNAPATSLDDYRSLLAGAAAKGVPALCCNPDRQMLTSSGLQPAPGAIAELYQQLGGKVTWIGKPFAGIYRYALKLLGKPDRKTVLCIGDSIAHDVRGGRDAGMATALVRTGVSALLDDEGLKRVMGEEGIEPDWLLPEFKWT
jgi:HAD superfamily hydrolase (TIGR01459 family)